MSNTFESRPSCASEPTDLIAARIHVREAVERYFHAIDARHVAQLRACFTDWITVRSMTNSAGDGGVTYEGPADAVAAELIDLAHMSDRSTHTCANLVQNIDDTGADVFAHATAVHLYVGSPDRVTVRGLRYHLRIVRGEAQWYIERLVHHALWQFDTDASEPALAQPLLLDQPPGEPDV
jgi:SnoaL-like domain